jgi:hypothetical protein
MRRFHVPLLAALSAAALLTGGCSYARDLQTICDAPAAVDVSGMAPENRQMALARYLDRQLQSPSGRSLFESLAMMDLENRASTLEAEARGAGIERCAFAELFRELAAASEAEPAYEVVTEPDDAGPAEDVD